MKRFLAICLALMLVVGVMPSRQAEAASATQYGTVVGGWLRLRESPSFSARTITSYYTGTVVTILGTSGDWYRVQTPTGRTGYMLGKFLRLGGGGGGTGTATVTSANGLGVRLRSGAGTGYRVIGVYPVGTVVTVLQTGTYWSRIQIGSVTGYMMSQFLTGSTPSPVEPVLYTARVTSRNGLGVRLRSGAGTGYAVLGVYSVGTAVSVLEHGSVWDKIRVGTRTGYMMNEFLLIDGTTNVLLSATLSNPNPVVGTVLKLGTLSPYGATASYQWKDSTGKVLSTSDSYTVVDTDIGHSICLTLTGVGSYTGTVTTPWSAIVPGTPVTPVVAVTLTGATIDNMNPQVDDVLTATVLPSGAAATFTWKRADGTIVGYTNSYKVGAADVGSTLYCIAVGISPFSTGTVASGFTAAVVAKPAADIPLTGSVSITPTSVKPGEVLTATLSLNCSKDQVTYQWYVNGNAISGATGATYTVPASQDAGVTFMVKVTAKAGSGYTGTVTSSTSVSTATDLNP